MSNNQCQTCKMFNVVQVKHRGRFYYQCLNCGQRTDSDGMRWLYEDDTAVPVLSDQDAAEWDYVQAEYQARADDKD